jgi:hypothetical protein
MTVLCARGSRTAKILFVPVERWLFRFFTPENSGVPFLNLPLNDPLMVTQKPLRRVSINLQQQTCTGLSHASKMLYE